MFKTLFKKKDEKEKNEEIEQKKGNETKKKHQKDEKKEEKTISEINKTSGSSYSYYQLLEHILLLCDGYKDEKNDIQGWKEYSEKLKRELLRIEYFYGKNESQSKKDAVISALDTTMKNMKTASWYPYYKGSRFYGELTIIHALTTEEKKLIINVKSEKRFSLSNSQEEQQNENTLTIDVQKRFLDPDFVVKNTDEVSRKNILNKVIEYFQSMFEEYRSWKTAEPEGAKEILKKCSKELEKVKKILVTSEFEKPKNKKGQTDSSFLQPEKVDTITDIIAWISDKLLPQVALSKQVVKDRSFFHGSYSSKQKKKIDQYSDPSNKDFYSEKYADLMKRINDFILEVKQTKSLLTPQNEKGPIPDNH